MSSLPPLPIDQALPELLRALDTGRNAVLVAPPGAGKTTRVPPALEGAGWAKGRILMLEPRRLAARAAAERIAAECGEAPGASVGYRIRGESKAGPKTRIEVVTEGILTRMLQRDPELTGVSAVIFDEIHERSIHSDLGLALALEVQGALRPDLRLLAMSATLDADRIAAVMGDCPIIESRGRMFPVETIWLDRPWRRPQGRGPRLEDAVADLVRQALDETGGDILVFLPGAGEIERTAAALKIRTDTVDICPLYGALPFSAQQRALRAGQRRRVVLATSIAETSLTVEGVRVVVDAGLARRSRVNTGTGMSQLVTVPVSRAEADQRRGRAGRTAPGVCFRLWTKGEEGALPAYAPPEILETDLAPLALELAVWGVEEPKDLALIDQPPEPALVEARKLLEDLGALASGRITDHGRALARMPTHPRLAHVMAVAGQEGQSPTAACLAALLAERDPLRSDGAAPSDIGLRVKGVTDPAALERETPHRIDRATAKRIKAEAQRLSRGGGMADPALAGVLLAHAYPDRIGLRRTGEEPRFLLSGGRGAALPPQDPLAAQRFLVAVDLEDRGREAMIRLAAPISEADLRRVHGESIRWVETAVWSRRTRQVEARRREILGEIALSDQRWQDAPPDLLGAALADGIRDRGLSALTWGKAAIALRHRASWARRADDSLPDLSDVVLLATLEDWLSPHLAGLVRIEQTDRLDLHQILLGLFDWDTRQRLDRIAPAKYTTPLGGSALIDYAGEAPAIAIRVQELFGVTKHPEVAGQPLLIELLSPAGRPVQTTQDLPRFWRGSYRDVAKDMRARYPKHPWPDDPSRAEPTRRAKTRRN
ncbi:MAG: ATP-dependent helicase HrpB [Pseudomonadota bacterium]